jgi:predicted transglutaminase-like cysteine proteinase
MAIGNQYTSDVKVIARVQRLPWRMLGLILWLAAIVLLPFTAGAISNPFFTVHEIRSTNLSAFVKWTSMLPRYQNEARDSRIDNMVASLRGKPVVKQLQEVNRFYNAVPYVEDIDNWGVSDYWATPQEMLSRGGDCEDYAIAKYLALKALGVPESQMRITIVQDNNLGGIIHAVLEVRHAGERYILDNQATEMVSATRIYHYRPIYAINTTAWWAYR